jgi:hypothetical protein
VGVAGLPAGRLGVDELAEPVEEGCLPGLDARGGQRRGQAEVVQDPGGGRQDVDADAEGHELRRGLEQAAAQPGAVQVQR